MEQLNILRALQCIEIQGFLFSPPVPADEATALLDQHIDSRLQPVTAYQVANS